MFYFLCHVQNKHDFVLINKLGARKIGIIMWFMVRKFQFDQEQQDFPEMMGKKHLNYYVNQIKATWTTLMDLQV